MDFRRICHLVLLILVLLASPAFAAERLRLATTTTTKDSGLLKVLLPPFEKKYNCRVEVISAGTGKALKLGEAGSVDVLLVHARKLEDEFVAAGFGVARRDVMYNDFVVIGPAADPARVLTARSARDAFRLIAGTGATFISRGDESGTHRKERELWQDAGVKPGGSWYVEAGKGMGDVIVMATKRGAYTLTDRGTFNAYRKMKTDLIPLFQGDPRLFNPYGVIAVNPRRHPLVKHNLAMRFISYLTEGEGRRIIAGFRVGGEPIFYVYGKERKQVRQ